jgi:hypothetical protein
MTKYILGSLDSKRYVAKVHVDLATRKHSIVLVTDREGEALSFERMTEAQLMIFNLESDDKLSVALNLIPLPVNDAGAVEYQATLEL